jgi:hypothetical protein
MLSRRLFSQVRTRVAVLALANVAEAWRCHAATATPLPQTTVERTHGERLPPQTPHMHPDRAPAAAEFRKARHRRSQARRRLDHALAEAKRLTAQHDRIVKGPRHGSKRETHLHELRKAVHTLALTLTSGEFVIATNDELWDLLKLCKVSNASGATHLASGALQVLIRQRLVAMDTQAATRLLLFLVNNRDNLPASHLAVAVTACVEKVLQASDESIAGLSLSRSVALLTALQQSTLIPISHGFEYLRRLMRLIPHRKHEVLPWHVAGVCRAVCHYRYADRVAVEFFADAVDVCLKNLDALSPKDAADILDAFATVGFHPTRLFLELGQLAGDHGEELSDADAARVINAFSKTEIDSSRLRTSLQASMRMRGALRFNKTPRRGAH